MSLSPVGRVGTCRPDRWAHPGGAEAAAAADACGSGLDVLPRCHPTAEMGRRYGFAPWARAGLF